MGMSEIKIELPAIKPLLADEVASRRQEVGRRKAVTQKFLVYLAPEQMANWIQVCALVLFFRALARQGRRGEVLTISVDRVGGSTRVGGGADRGMATHTSWHQQPVGSSGLQLESLWSPRAPVLS